MPARRSAAKAASGQSWRISSRSIPKRAVASAAHNGPALFASFKPYGDSRLGVSVATGFVDFSTGRESIVTAAGPGGPAEVKVFAFPLFKSIANAATKPDTMADHA